MAREKIGQYDVEDIIGDGGMGTVYRARDPRFDRQVAIKVLHPQFRRDPNVAERFKNEAVIQAKLNHPNIVTVYDFVVEDDVLAFVMEHVEGDSLGGLIEQATGPIALDRCSDIMKQVLSAMGYAHSQGLVHRDLKPSNILVQKVGGEDVVKVMDFGIAKILGDEKMRTATGATMGTLAYMSPEHMRSSKAVDARSDIYSLGATFFELVTGTVPIQADTEFDLMCRIVEEPPRPPSAVRSNVPQSMDKAILCSLAKDPAQRFATCELFRTALIDGSATEQPVPPIPAAPPPSAPPPRQWVAPPGGAQPAPPPMSALPAPDPRFTPHGSAPGLWPSSQPPPVVMPEAGEAVYVPPEDTSFEQARKAWKGLDGAVRAHVVETLWHLLILLCGLPMVLVSWGGGWSFLTLAPVLVPVLITRWVVHANDFDREDRVKLPVVVFDAQLLAPFRFHEVLTGREEQDRTVRAWVFLAMVVVGVLGAFVPVRIAVFSVFSSSIVVGVARLLVAGVVWLVVLWSIAVVAFRIGSIVAHEKGVRDVAAPIDLSRPHKLVASDARQAFNQVMLDVMAGPVLWFSFGLLFLSGWQYRAYYDAYPQLIASRLTFSLLGTVLVASILAFPKADAGDDGRFLRVIKLAFQNPFRQADSAQGGVGKLVRKVVLVLCALIVFLLMKSMVSWILIQGRQGMPTSSVVVGAVVALATVSVFSVGMVSTALTATKLLGVTQSKTKLS